MYDSCIITVVNGYEVRFHFKYDTLDKVLKIKHGFIISKVGRKQRKKFKKVVKYYLKFFLENNEELFGKMCEFYHDSKLISWCKDTINTYEYELEDLIKLASEKRNNLIKIRNIYL